MPAYKQIKPFWDPIHFFHVVLFVIRLFSIFFSKTYNSSTLFSGIPFTAMEVVSLIAFLMSGRIFWLSRLFQG